MPTPTVIRGIIAPILRKWISDNGLAPLHRAAREESSFVVDDCPEDIGLCEKGFYKHWTAELPILNTRVSTGQLSDSSRSLPSARSRTISVPFKKFANQRMAYSAGRFLNRRDSVRFVADRMGGAHTTYQAKFKPHDPVEFFNLTGFVVDKSSRNVRILANLNDESALHKGNGAFVYSVVHLIVLDTARRFFDGLSRWPRLVD